MIQIQDNQAPDDCVTRSRKRTSKGPRCGDNAQSLRCTCDSPGCTEVSPRTEMFLYFSVDSFGQLKKRSSSNCHLEGKNSLRRTVPTVRVNGQLCLDSRAQDPGRIARHGAIHKVALVSAVTSGFSVRDRLTVGPSQIW
jgi:hypothetical protein